MLEYRNFTMNTIRSTCFVRVYVFNCDLMSSLRTLLSEPWSLDIPISILESDGLLLYIFSGNVQGLEFDLTRE